jgi:hypothetical protein
MADSDTPHRDLVVDGSGAEVGVGVRGKREKGGKGCQCRPSRAVASYRSLNKSPLIEDKLGACPETEVCPSFRILLFSHHIREVV